MEYSRDRLIELVKEKALKFGDFTLASGKTAKYYLDCRKLSLDPEGANVIGAGILDAMGDDLPDAVGGMAIGADPITASVITLGWQRGASIMGFIVRKEAKQHGTGQAVEGPVKAGQSAIIVEDVVTSGGSSLRAIEKAKEFGLNVRSVISVVDRLAGASELFESNGVEFRTLLTIKDLGVE